jgi:hypothetical protein
VRVIAFTPGWHVARVLMVFLFGVACREHPSPVLDDTPPRGVLPADVGATPPPVQRYVALRTLGPITVDGHLDDPTWQVVVWSEPFVDIEGSRKPVPPWSTRVALAWDDEALYIAARMEEPHLWATITQRDAVIFHDNDFEMFLDPDGDTHRYYELEINALGTVWDLFLDRPYRDAGRALDDWNIGGLRSAVALQGTLNDPADEDEGWTVELAVPWSGLQDPDGDPEQRPHHGDRWRINFSRVQWHLVFDTVGYRKAVTADGRVRAEQNWVWSPQDAINMHMPEMWGVVEFHTDPVGSDAAISHPVEDEAVRWVLRRVYYAQRQYYDTHGRFAESLDDLGFDALEGTLNATGAGDGYSAVAQGATGALWAIDQTGRVWHYNGGPQ